MSATIEPFESDYPDTIWWNPYAVERVRLTTTLAPDECAQRIRKNIHNLYDWGGYNWDGVRRVSFLGSVRGERFTLYKFTARFRSSFKPGAHGRLEPDGSGGTVVNIAFKLFWWARLWFGMLLGIFAGALILACLGATGIWVTIPNLADPFSPLLVIIIAFPTGCIVYLFYVVAFLFSAKERRYIVDALRDILQASVTQDVQPTQRNSG